MMGRFFILFTISFLFSVSFFAQRGKTDEQLKPSEIERNADLYLQEGKFEKALLLYRRLHGTNEESPKLNFLLGYCYLNTEFGLDKAITYLERSIDLSTTNASEKAPLESYYYLALAYHQNEKYKLAIEHLDELLIKIPESNQLFKSQVNKLKVFCQNAKMLAQSKVGINVENLYELNSKYSDKNPLILNNGREIIFTSSRDNPQVRGKAKTKGLDDNIYYSKIENGTWTIPFGISKSVNTLNHESACWVSEDGKFLIIHRIEKNKSYILYSERTNNSDWSVPMKFPAPINTKNNETFGSFSPDRKFLFFTSDRRGGQGGSDIYVSENLGDNKWGEPENLGPRVNTKEHEESPVMHENGVLFFCSNGHVSMGGFDIFTTFKDEKNEWKTATNLGAPINSIKDDFFYQPLAHGQYAFTSSQRQGTKGHSDIFKYRLNDTTGIGYALATGKINCSKEIEPDKTIEIIVRELKGGFKVSSFKTNKYGDFTIVLPAAKDYQITYAYQKQVFFEGLLKFAKSYSYLVNDQSIRIEDVNLSLYDDSKIIKPLTKSVKNKVYYSDEKITATIKLGPGIVKKETARKDSIILSDANIPDEGLPNETNVGNQIYSIKLVSSKSKMLLSFFNGIDDVKEYQDENGAYFYYFGEYNYEWEAEIKLRLIHDSYPEATVFVNSLVNRVTN